MTSGSITVQLPKFKYNPESNASSDQPYALEKWQNETRQTLERLQGVLSSADLQKLTVDELASIHSILQSLTIPEDFISQDIVSVATDMSNQLPQASFDIVKSTLLHHVKPLYARVSHTLIDSNSGRSLHRPAGGPSNSLDFYEEQDWKRRPGLSCLITWCIQSLKTDEFAEVWHLIVPPSMTFLDDYESYYKLKGIRIISQFIDKVPIYLLKRTGIDGLIKKSLNTSLLHLHTPQSPKIIQLSASTLIRSIRLISPPGSRQRFDQLCALLGNGIINNIWVFAYQDFETIEASLLVSCEVVEELGIGAVRYLKPMLQQIVQYLSSDAGPYVFRLQKAALKLLKVILMSCRHRIHTWSTMLLDAILKCWVGLQDQKISSDEDLADLLKKAVDELITIVPSQTLHCRSIIALDEQVFAPLFRRGITAEDRPMSYIHS